MKDNDTHIPTTSTPPPSRARSEPPIDEQPTWSDGFESDGVDADSVLSYHKPGVNQRTMRDLAGGKFPIRATLDLHGNTVDSARATLHRFIQRQSVAHRVCVCIIHGKGQRGGDFPVLKTKVNVWLRQSEAVVAFHSAPARQGGTGALLVLLK